MSRGAVREESYGPVVTTPGERGYIGAEVGTNNTGELSAMVEALRCRRDPGKKSFLPI